MRRIKSACLLQTIRFDTANGENPKQEFEAYCRRLERKKTKYAVEETEEQPDGSLLVKLRKQYNTYGMEGYLE